MKKLRVCVVTGTRAEFGIWRPVRDAIQTSRRLELQLVVTGMHLQREFGFTVRDIEHANYNIAARVAMYRAGEPSSASLARGIAGLGAAFRRLKSDLVFVLGDRLEMLAAASAALAERLILAHVHGGETAPGIWDEQIRHALTKMAHLHFCATRKAKHRILQMGENPAHVHTVGAPALDSLSQQCGTIPIKSARPTTSIIQPMLVLHPSGGTDEVEYRRAMMVLNALEKTLPGLRILTVGPNNDPGHRGILRAYHKQRTQVELEMSLPQSTFWVELANGGVLVGNSSSGIIEAATVGVAVVNIGDRQAGRERSENVIDVRWKDGVAGIERALGRAMTDRAFLRRVSSRKNVYGDGHASQRIIAVLEKVAQSGISTVKQFHDH